ncbi:hypothetical protein TWF696_005592 [Orbilia brochopaga]|uniref:Uncharacterized protein n=1 Tax=Orbilia brochopaga TaxID=3140254 RepID=A0AAV9V2H6_9PEZI
MLLLYVQGVYEFSAPTDTERRSLVENIARKVVEIEREPEVVKSASRLIKEPKRRKFRIEGLRMALECEERFCIEYDMALRKARSEARDGMMAEATEVSYYC